MAMANQIINPILDPISPYYLSPNENPGAVLVPALLSGDNYHAWSRAMIMALQMKNKMMFVDGSLPKPETHDQLYTVWSRCNSLVVSWITHSIQPSMVQSILWMDTAKEIWDDLKE
ncbi:PREDICTED: uncharacterized protein LOC109338595, partial [Lupinus angustifolius]|uniref:uncharacterized protein LOC109338595 n=1 Tax=Lupinus angustifolius TaxID=3871 RepID=UPI00092E8115